jgi:bifunctional NMN adenylyltransferase/nudix hydrolase
VETNFGVYIGRFNPVHLGHQAVIDEMIRHYGHHSMIIVGSCNTPQSMRHYFNYIERRWFMKALYPHTNVVGLPDYPNNDKEWFQALDDLIQLKQYYLDKVEFFGGCDEDVIWLKEQGRNVSILNRFDGTTPLISATQVRDALIHDRSLDGMIHSDIQQPMREMFKRKWAEFEKR